MSYYPYIFGLSWYSMGCLQSAFLRKLKTKGKRIQNNRRRLNCLFVKKNFRISQLNRLVKLCQHFKACCVGENCDFITSNNTNVNNTNDNTYYINNNSNNKNNLLEIQFRSFFKLRTPWWVINICSPVLPPFLIVTFRAGKL